MLRLRTVEPGLEGDGVYEARSVLSVFWRTPSPEESRRLAAGDILASLSVDQRSLPPPAPLEPDTRGLHRLDRAADRAFDFLSRWAWFAFSFN